MGEANQFGGEVRRTARHAAPETNVRTTAARPAAGTQPRPRPTAGTASARPRATAQGTAKPRPTGASSNKKPLPAKKRAKKTGIAAFGSAIMGKLDVLLGVKPGKPSPKSPAPRRQGPDWAMILALVVMVVILIGIIALIVIGAKSCIGGCSSTTTTADAGGAKIYLMETPAPSDADGMTAQTAGDENANTENGDQAIAASNIGVNTPATSGGLRRARIRNIGDFVIHDVIFESAQKLSASTGVDYPYNFAPMLNLIRGVMENADFTVTNVDGSLGGKQYYKYGYSGYPQFNTPPYILYALNDAGVDMLTLANNHMLDGWYDGLMATIENVEKVGLKHIGANRSTEEKNSAVIYEINGIKVGFLNYTVSLNSMETQSSLDKRALQFGVNATRNSDAAKDAKTLRDAGAEVIVCYMHWGTEYEDIDNNQTTYAKALVQAGVDVIIGGHPHVVQPAKWLTGTNQFGETQRTLCLYSMGNFLSDQRTKLRDGGIIFDFTIEERADGSFDITNPTYLPTWVWRTGNDITGYSYQIVPIGQYINSRPEGMNDSDYSRMIESYQESVAAMGTGVGTLVSE